MVLGLKWHFTAWKNIHTFNAIPSRFQSVFHREKCGDVTGSQRVSASFFWSKRAGSPQRENLGIAPTWSKAGPRVMDWARRGWKEQEKESQAGNFLSAAGINIDFPRMIPWKWDFAEGQERGCFRVEISTCGFVATNSTWASNSTPNSSSSQVSLMPRWRKEWFEELDKLFKLWNELSGRWSLLSESSSDSLEAPLECKEIIGGGNSRVCHVGWPLIERQGDKAGVEVPLPHFNALWRNRKSWNGSGWEGV